MNKQADDRSVVNVRTTRQLPEDWDTLNGSADLYVSARWLESQSAGFTELGGIAATVRSQDGNLVAALPMFRLDDDASLPRFIHPAWLLSRHLSGRDARQLMPSLLCGGRHPMVTRALTNPAWDRGSLITDLIEAAVAHASAASLSSVVFLYVDEDDESFRRALEDAGFTRVFRHETFFLDIEWPDFAGYLMSRRRRRRRSIEHELRQLSNQGVQLEMICLSDAPFDRLTDLTAQRRAKYGHETDHASMTTVFERLAKNFGERAKVFLARIDGVIAGYSLTFEWRDHMHVWSTGADYQLQGTLPLYFWVTYYGPIARAAERGFSAIAYGPTAAEAKTFRGCRSVGHFSYYRALNADVDRWLREQAAS